MARRSQARRNARGPLPPWIWLLAGLLLGLGLVVAWLSLRPGQDEFDPLRPTPNPDEAAAVPSSDEAVAEPVPEPPRPRYDFYTLLPEREVEIPDAELSAQARAEAEAEARVQEAAPAAPADPATPAVDAGPHYILQAGAFRSQPDAETLKAQIALTGEIARVETAEIQGQTIYRVRMGPYPNARALEAAKQALRSHGIEGQAIRVR
jgi:cell division protein FtsN